MKKKVSIKEKINYFIQEKALLWTSFLIVCSVLFMIRFSGEIKLYYSQKLEDKVLTAIYDEEKYVVEGLPKMVDIVVEGGEAQVKRVIAKNELTANVDLSNLAEGQHIVPIEVKPSINNVFVEANPQNVSILIKPKVSEERTIQLDYINQEKKDSRVELGEAMVSSQTVVITGAKDAVEKVVAVKALVDVSNPADLIEYQAPLYAMGEDGTRIEVQIEPAVITVSIPSDTPNKTVPFKVSVDDLPDDKAIESISLSEELVTIYAPKHILNSISDIKVLIPYDKINEAGEVNVEITPPSSVTEYTVTKLNVKVAIVKKESVILENVPVELRNVPSNLVIKEQPVTSVTLKGAKSVIGQISVNDLKLYVDGKTVKKGLNELTVLCDTVKPNVDIITDKVQVDAN